jgi:cation transport regulator
LLKGFAANAAPAFEGTRFESSTQTRQEIFLAAFNNANEEYKEEETAFKVAWSAVKRDYEKGEDGNWHKKPE